jgi:hypothetical protein
MNPSEGHDPAGGIATLVERTRSKGVKLWSEAGRLRYAAPKGVLTTLDLEVLKSSNEGILSFLESENRLPSDLGLQPLLSTDDAPLTFSQLAGWQLLGLDSRASARQVAWAVRICGHLNVEFLEAAIAELVRRHEALRTRIVTRAKQIRQVVDEPRLPVLRIVDLGAMPGDTVDTQIVRRIEAFTSENVSVAIGPLFQAMLLRHTDDDHALLIALDHLISDAFSLSILLRELCTAYTQRIQGKVISLPSVAIQFCGYARWQSEMWGSWSPIHGDYWRSLLEGFRVARFPPGLALVQIPDCRRTLPILRQSDSRSREHDWVLRLGAPCSHRTCRERRLSCGYATKH